jgi:hypothetical protein
MFGLVRCPLLAVTTAFAALVWRRKLIVACDPGDSGAPFEGAYVLLFLGPVITVAAFVVVTTTYGAISALVGSRGVVLAVAVSLIVAVVVAYVAVVWTHDPIDNAHCPGGVPLWWPSWLPLGR